jgi:serine/threonine protein kinase
MALPLGTPVQDRYVIEGLLGQGGFSVVYLVRDRRANQNLFALKEMSNQNKHDRERFIFEGELLKRLDHRALPRVYRVFEHAKLKRVYILMDYIKGRNLKVLRDEQPEQRFSLPVALAIMAPVVDALIYLHSQDPPIVHRDVKLANIIVPRGTDEAVLVDFGSAKEYVTDETTALIRQCSPGYAAPEQYGSGTTPRTDIYGLGATFYTLLTGRIPSDAIARVVGSKGGIDPLQPVHLLAPTLPTAVAQAIERALSISSENRFETVEEFWQALNAHAPQQQVQILRVTSGDAPQSIPVSEQGSERKTSASLQNPQDVPRSRKPDGLFFAVILALLLIVASGAGFLSSTIIKHDHALSAQQKSSHLLATSTLAPIPSMYPHIATSYAGTIADLLAKEKTDMFLTNIQQSQGNIHGFFQGLGLVSSFTGTVTPDGHIRFAVIASASNMTLSFEGDIKIGGDIVGTFRVLDHNGHFTGEFGLWNIGANP